MASPELTALRHCGQACRRSTGTLSSVVGLAALVLSSSSCRDAVRAFGPTPGAARTHADDYLTAEINRFAEVQRNAKYESARKRMTHAALTPSRAFDDTAVWTSAPTASTRMLMVSGDLVDGRYELDAMPNAPPPAHLGATRHTITLSRFDPKSYVWDTSVEFGVGELTANDVGDLFTALYAAAEGHTERELRDQYRAAFPRTSASLGRLFSVDTLRPVLLVDGSTMVTVTLAMHPGNPALHDQYPAFASFLNKYFVTARYHLFLTDLTNTPWLDIAAHDGLTTVRFRTQHGHLLPLGGAARPMPDTLHLHSDIFLHIKMFTVGVRDLDMEFVITHAPHERAFTAVGRREPQWQLPLATEHVIRASLRRPFEGTGAIFRLSVVDDEHEGGQTMITRFSHLAVQESKVLKFVGGLGAHAATDLAGHSEREEDAFLRETFEALRADVRALLGGGRRENAADR